MDENRNIPVVSVDEAVQDISGLYVSVINKRLPLKVIPAPFLWGPPGAGKSEAILQIAENIMRETGKKVKITDVRLLLFSPVDLRGVPVADEEHKFADWLMPRIFDMEPSEDTVNILFLDELSAAPQSVQAAAYQITLNRTIGEHKLPDNTIIIAAGNRMTDRSVAFRMPNALANRLMHMEVKVSFDSWKRWAEDNGVNPLVIGYLSFDNSKLIKAEVALDDVAFPTPRSWTFVSDILNSSGISKLDSLYHVIAACIGNDTALEFIAWARVGHELPKVKDIFAGKNPPYPKSQDALYALSGSISTYVADKCTTITVAELDNMCAYVEKFPADFAMMLFKNLVKNEKVKVKLLKASLFRNWSLKNLKNLGGNLEGLWN